MTELIGSGLHSTVVKLDDNPNLVGKVGLLTPDILKINQSLYHIGIAPSIVSISFYPLGQLQTNKCCEWQTKILNGEILGGIEVFWEGTELWDEFDHYTQFVNKSSHSELIEKSSSHFLCKYFVQYVDFNFLQSYNSSNEKHIEQIKQLFKWADKNSVVLEDATPDKVFFNKFTSKLIIVDPSLFYYSNESESRNQQVLELFFPKSERLGD